MLEILRSMGYNKVPELPFYIHQDYDRLYVYEIENMRGRLYPLNVIKGGNILLSHMPMKAIKFIGLRQ